MIKKEKTFPKNCIECNKTFKVKHYEALVYCSDLCENIAEKRFQTHYYEHTAIYRKQDIIKLLDTLPAWANNMRDSIKYDIMGRSGFFFNYLHEVGEFGQMSYVCGSKNVQVTHLQENRFQVKY